jgi:hypothetical protein
LQPQAGFGAEQQNQQSLALAFMQLSEQLGQLVGVGFQIGDHSVPNDGLRFGVERAIIITITHGANSAVATLADR